MGGGGGVCVCVCVCVLWGGGGGGVVPCGDYSAAEGAVLPLIRLRQLDVSK